jgi:hypothetical protein
VSGSMAAMLTLAALVALQAQPKPGTPLVEYPHPLITEVLFAVPTRDGDANKDGTREANGDEFIELYNPHDKPIQLRGYTLSGKGPRGGQGASGAPSAKGERKFSTLRFTFPTFELQPGEVAVVFNGYAQSWSGPVGDALRAPEGPNEHFENARVFSMKVESARLGLVNTADFVLLTAPSGQKVHCIHWGDIRPPEGVARAEEAPSTQGSVTRLTPAGELVAHPSLDGLRFSPGKFPLIADAPAKKSLPGAPGEPAR